jgi:hypothetical protein
MGSLLSKNVVHMRANPAPPSKVIPEEIPARNPRPKTETQQARGEDVGDFGQAFVSGHLVHNILRGRHCLLLLAPRRLRLQAFV